MTITDVKTIRQCLKVAELRSMSRAAEALNIAQPWLSTRIRNHEAELGFELFDRSRRQLALTPQGEAWLETARRFLEAADHHVRTARAIAAPAAVELRLGCPAAASGVAERDELIRAFRGKYPQVSVRINLIPVTELPDALRGGAIDLALMLDPLPDEIDPAGVVVLRRQRTVIFMPNEWKREPGTPLSPADLRDREIAIISEVYSPRLSGPIYAALREAGARLVEMSDDNFVALHFHAIKHGIAAVTVDSFADTLAHVMSHTCLPMPGELFQSRLSLVRPPATAPREAKLFWQFANAWCNRERSKPDL